MKKHHIMVVVFLLILIIAFFSLKKMNDDNYKAEELQQTHERIVVSTLTQISNVFIIDPVDDCLETQEVYLYAYSGLVKLKEHLQSAPIKSNHLLTITGYLDLYFQHYDCPDRYAVDQDVVRNLMMDIISDVDNEAYYLELETYLAKIISQKP
jgi:uncharacterized membrane protein YwzB